MEIDIKVTVMYDFGEKKFYTLEEMRNSFDIVIR